MDSDDAQPQPPPLRRIKYLAPPWTYAHFTIAPSRRMSNLRDQTSVSHRAHPYAHRKATPNNAAGPSGNPASFYGEALTSSNRLVLPSLSSSFPNNHSELHHEMLSSSRTQAMRSDPFSPSFNSGLWPNNGHSTMPDYSYNHASVDPFDARHHSSTPPNPYRQSPVSGAPAEPHRRAPQLTIPSGPPRNEPWASNYYTSPSYPSDANFALTSGPPDVGAHSQSYPANYGMSFHTGPHQGPTYPSIAHPTMDPLARHPPQGSHHGHYQPEAHQPANRPGHPSDWPVHQHQRNETHLVSPYARTSHKETSTSPLDASPIEFPAAKKKRRRADANQLKVLNDVYARTAFPSTEERLDLAKRLDMSARSVQIWFQNKRQSARSRTAANANAAHQPMIHNSYMGGGPQSHAGPSHQPMPGHGHGHGHSHVHARPGAEMSVSPSAGHGGSYTVQPPASGSHRSYRAQSPSNIPLPDALRRVRSPEGSSRLRAPSGRP